MITIHVWQPLGSKICLHIYGSFRFAYHSTFKFIPLPLKRALRHFHSFKVNTSLATCPGSTINEMSPQKVPAKINVWGKFISLGAIKFYWEVIIFVKRIS